MTVTLWRLPLLVRDLRSATAVNDRRVASARHALLALRDAPFLLVLPLLLYRLPKALLKLVAASKSLRTAPPALTLTSASAGFWEDHLHLTVSGTKQSDVTADRRFPATLYSMLHTLYRRQALPRYAYC